MTRDTYLFSKPGVTPEQYVELFARYYGPTMNAVDAARANGKEPAIRDELVALTRSFNKGGANAISIAATFMRVTVAV